MQKRENYLTWDGYFMGIAILSSKRSKDPSTQVGACIVNKEDKIVGIGYNGLPNGIDDNDMPWEREGEWLDTKYPYVCHAEMNAIVNSTKDLKGCRIYVTLFPCNDCSKFIIQSGIKEIIYYSDKYKDTDSNTASKKLLDMVGIRYRLFDKEENNLEDYIVI